MTDPPVDAAGQVVDETFVLVATVEDADPSGVLRAPPLPPAGTVP